MRTIVVMDKITKQVMACIPDTGGDAFVRKDIEIKVYNGTEPIFTVTDNVCRLKENTFLIEL